MNLPHPYAWSFKAKPDPLVSKGHTMGDFHLLLQYPCGIVEANSALHIRAYLLSSSDQSYVDRNLWNGGLESSIAYQPDASTV